MSRGVCAVRGVCYVVARASLRAGLVSTVRELRAAAIREGVDEVLTTSQGIFHTSVASFGHVRGAMLSRDPLFHWC